MNNYFTPYEWNDTRTKLAFDVAKRILKKDNPKIGAFVQVTDDHSMDSYEYIKNFITDDVYAIKLVHAKSDQYWNYKYKLDDNIKKMLAFSPDIILNSNSKDLDEITETILYKMTDRGFKGVFIDTGSWGCSESSISRYLNTYKKTKGASTGISVSHKKCFKYYESEEKKFRNKIIHKDDKYYSNSGLFYKTLRHVLVSILNSPLELNSNNIKKIIMNHPYFQGFSHTNYSLYKKKDSPEFLSIYKYYFRKDFRLENISNKKLIKDVVKNFKKN